MLANCALPGRLEEWAFEGLNPGMLLQLTVDLVVCRRLGSPPSGFGVSSSGPGLLAGFQSCGSVLGLPPNLGTIEGEVGEIGTLPGERHSMTIIY